MSLLERYTEQSAYSDPGRHVELIDALPRDIRGLTAVVRNLVVHYRAAGITFEGERLAEVDSRWVRRMLDADQSRFPGPLDAPRPPDQRIVGCCRDFTLLTVSALRHQGVPARSRIGFSPYFAEDYHYDHVVAQWWDGSRWVMTDAQLEPGPQWSFDTSDVPHFETAARVWTALRRGEIDPSVYGVAPGVPVGGDWFIHGYVFQELAHRQRDETLLWDEWGAMTGDFARADVGLADEVAALLLEADSGSGTAEAELAARYAADDRLRPGRTVLSHSPTGTTMKVDLWGEIQLGDRGNKND